MGMIKLGTLVEIEETGARLFVVYHAKDCDGRTDLYWLSPDKGDTQQAHPMLADQKWAGGHPKWSLRRIHR